MPALTSDGKIKVAVLATLTSMALPSLAEILAGPVPNAEERIDFGGLIGFELDTGRVPTRPLAGDFATERMGNRSGSNAMIRWQRHDGVDPMATTLVYKADLYVVIRRNLDYEIAWAIGQDVETYAVNMGEQKRLPPAEDTLTLVESPVAFHTVPNLEAVIAA